METVALKPARITEAMRARKMTPEDLAYEIRRLSNGRVRATATQVLRWARGQHEPRASVIGLIAAATAKPLDFFYGSDGEEEEGDDPG